MMKIRRHLKFLEKQKRVFRDWVEEQPLESLSDFLLEEQPKKKV